jgi:hypothetical protein
VTGGINIDFLLYKRVLDISTVVYDDTYDQNRYIYANDTENQLHGDENIEPQTQNALIAM